MFRFRFALVLGVVFATILGATPAQAYIAVARTTYVVQVKTGSSDAVRAVIGKLGETPHDELTEVMDGFVLDMTDIEAATLRSDANVIQVVADQTVSMLDTETPTPSWGLDRIDQTNTTYDSSYSYPASAGTGVNVYVVDTGVMASDPDFGNRVATGVDLLGQNLQGADCNGHGTHVAGTIAGTKYGVAKKATIVPIRVLGCGGSGSMSTIISAIDWIIANNPAGTPAVMSASIGGGKYQLVNDAIEKLYQAGITPVIAAGNNNADAAGYSPASAPNAITVGASDSTDARASFSNFGDLVDVFAPGVGIASDNYLDPTTPKTLSGTSMATPHVSGLAALYLADHPSATPAQVTAAIQAGAQAGIIVDAKSANGNYLINNKFTNAALPPVGAPTNVAVSAITATSATATWSAPTGTQAANSYKVEYKESSAATWLSVDSATTTTNLTGLSANTTYSLRVSSIADAVTSPASSELIFSTLADVPDPVTNVRSTASFGNQVTIAWDAPANANGSAIKTYEVWMNVAGTWTKKNVVSVTTATVTALQPSTTYSVRVVAVSLIGSSVPSAELSITTTSATPGAVVLAGVSATTANGVTVAWRAVSPIDSATAISYTVAVTDYATGASVVNYTTSTLSQVITGLTRFTYYKIAVTAYSGSVAGPASAAYTFRTLADVPTAVTGLTVSKLNATQFTISWNGPRDNGGSAVTGYKVEQFVAGAWALIATNDATVSSLVVASPAAGMSEQYRVSVTNAIGAGPTTQIAVTGTIVAPQPPTGLTVTPAAGSTTTGVLAWIAPTNTGGAAVSGYNLFRSVDGGTTWITIANGVATLNYNVSLPAKGVTWQYAVVAVNTVGQSPKSAPVSYTTAATVSGPTTTPVLSWNTDGTLNIVWSAPSDNGGSAVTSYKVQRLVGTTWTVVATVAANATSTSLPRDAVGTSYSINVIATNAGGDSVASAVATISVPAARSSAPQNLTGLIDSTGRLILSWQAPANNGGSAPSSYTVQYSTNNASTWTTLSSTTLLSASFAAPPKGSTYLYRVFATTSAGNSDNSNVVSISPQVTAPGAPVMRSITFATDGSLVIAWNPPADNGGSAITGYRIETSTNATTFATAGSVAATANSITLARPAAGVRIYARVFAITAQGESAASATSSILTAYVKASAPLNLTATDTGSVVTLAWAAPSNLGGSTSVSYTPQVSKDLGVTWSNLSSTATLTLNVTRPTKGSTWQFRVVANTSFGLSDYSNTASVSVAATVSSTAIWSFAGFNGNGSMDLRWLAPTDNGGSAITSYIVEKSFDLITWTAVSNQSSANALSLNLPRENPGVRAYFRIFAVNAVGTSAASLNASIATPYLKASAPTALTATESGSIVVLAWGAPANLGGSASVSYSVQISRDNATTWGTITTIAGLTYNVSRPAKGTTNLYRIVANTAFGLSEYSNIASVSVAASAPSAPSFASLLLNTATSTIDLRWYSPTDNGGSAITNFFIQKSLDNINFANAATVAGNVLSTSVSRDNPGVRSYWRIVAQNAIGSSNASTVYTIQMPYVQASAPQNFEAVDNGSYVVTRWAAPADLGGSTSIYYYVQYSTNNSTTWLNYVSTSALTYNVPRPAKGTTTAYRVVAVTSFGVGQYSPAISVTAAATAPSVPSIRSFTLNSDLTSTLVFNAPSDNGGSAISGYIVEQSTNQSTWSVLATNASATAPFVVAAQAPGVRIYVRVTAVNAVGSSPASAVYSVQMPYVQASAVQNLTINNGSNSYVTLTWAAPSNLGGVTAVSSYQVQSSLDGVNWTVLGSTAALTATVSRPAKGVAISYRVLANTIWGLGLPSAAVAASVVTTITSVPLVISAVKSTTANVFNITFNQPTDLGGVSGWTYKVQTLQGSTWVTVASAAGAATNVAQIASPAAGVYQSVRVIATNSVGDSSPYSFTIRG